MLALHLCPFDAVDDGLSEAYLALLSAEERQRHMELRRAEARRQFLIGRALLRLTLARQLHCEPAALAFGRSAQGKPVLREPVAGWHFNLSHSRGWAALALSDAGEVGVDVEFRGRRNDLAGIAQRFYQPAEAQALAALPEGLRRRRFFELWTVKEAAVKALGRGIAIALAGTGVRYRDDDRIELQLTGGAHWPGPVRAWHYDMGDDCSLAAVLLGRDQAPQLFETVPLRSSRRLALEPSLSGADAGHDAPHLWSM
jgi:4'-phosphopantetheinyl transferase